MVTVGSYLAKYRIQDLQRWNINVTAKNFGSEGENLIL